MGWELRWVKENTQATSFQREKSSQNEAAQPKCASGREISAVEARLTAQLFLKLQVQVARLLA